jgi:hypothetical protein
MKILELKKIWHKKGFEYIASTNHTGLSSHKTPSSAIVLEDGKPLPGPANTLHEHIRNAGRGRYSLWFGLVHFSTSDNSDPRTNGRSYSLQYEESEAGQFASLQRVLYLPTKLIHLPFLPVSLKSFFEDVGYGIESFKHLGLSFPFWSLYYWFSFIYLMVHHDDD